MKTLNRVVGLMVCCGTLVSVVSNASAQDALDRDLNVNNRSGSYGTGQLRNSFRDEVRLRNAVVTGNAPGGKSLRVKSGYRDPSEYTGGLNSDSLFRFQRDSVGYSNGSFAGSSLSANGVGYRGSNSLRFTYSNSTGSGSGLVSRFGGQGLSQGVESSISSPRRNLSNIPSGTGSGGALDSSLSANEDDSINYDAQRPRLGTLRSTGAFTANRSYAPTLVFDKNEAITASGLLGLRQVLKTEIRAFRPAPADPGAANDPELALRREREQGRSTSPTNSAAGSFANDFSADLSASTAARTDRSRTSYDELIERIEKASAKRTPAGQSDTLKNAVNELAGDGAKAGDQPKPEAASSTVPSWRERLDKVREAMNDDASDAKRNSRDADAKKDPNAPSRGGGSGGGGGGGRAIPIDDQTLEELREASVAEATLIKNSKDLFGTLMQLGQSDMAAKRYFDAEERFASAMVMRPGDVSARTGRLHAQIAAGLYTSAALNLRGLLTQHPEVIATRYEGEANAPKERALFAAGELRTMYDTLMRNENTKGAAREPALVLAYLGFQYSDAEMLADGLAKLREAEALPQGRGAAIADVLEKLWTKPAGEKSPSETPAK